MKRETIEHLLHYLERAIAEGRAEIGKQIHHIQLLRDSGQNIADALDLLKALEKAQAKNLLERDRLKQRLIEKAH
jgi:hypothetical protein